VEGAFLYLRQSTNGRLSYKPLDSATIEGATSALSKQINMKSLALKGRTEGQGCWAADAFYAN
jgi:hypothetical protein